MLYEDNITKHLSSRVCSYVSVRGAAIKGDMSGRNLRAICQVASNVFFKILPDVLYITYTYRSIDLFHEQLYK